MIISKTVIILENTILFFILRTINIDNFVNKRVKHYVLNKSKLFSYFTEIFPGLL